MNLLLSPYLLTSVTCWSSHLNACAPSPGSSPLLCFRRSPSLISPGQLQQLLNMPCRQQPPAIHSRFPLPSLSSKMGAVSPSLFQRDEIQTPECAVQSLLESSSWFSLLLHSPRCPTTGHILQPDKMTSYLPNTHVFSSVFDSSPIFLYMLHAFPSPPLVLSLHHARESEASTFLSPPPSQRKQW